MKSKFKKSADRRFLSPGFFEPYLDDFIHQLSENGYTELTIQGYYDSVAHFGTWLQKKNIPLKKITNKAFRNFAKHHCFCVSNRKAKKLSRQYVRRVQHFISYICNKRIILLKIPPAKMSASPLIKFKESLESRGLSEKTIMSYEYSIQNLLPYLGKNSNKYNATLIRQVISDAAQKQSRCAVKKLTTALRAYLRFLATENKCSPDLDMAIPTIAEWKLSSLPKYITVNELERVIALCDIHTRQGLRDRAIILLLGRLGLRAGDVSNMQINDIDWLNGTLRVNGKCRREVLLPLPQEVGDAISAYIEKVRPSIDIDTLFLCLNAPYRSFSSSSIISSVVSAALSRAGITNPPSRGAHLLRHTAATNMLRNGATLEAVSAVLRHRSLDMTVYYAKVDIPRLIKIAQPWPEDTLC